jgi:small subunit ribosomal protein S16
MGRKKQAHYRIVVADSASPRDGRFVETLGYYKPLSSPARLVVDLDKAEEWIAKGAEQSETIRTLLNKARKGGDAKVAIGEVDADEAKVAKAAAIEARREGEAKAREDAAAAVVAQDAAAAAVVQEAAAAAAIDAEEAAQAEAAAAEPAAEVAAEPVVEAAAAPEAEVAAAEPAAEVAAEPVVEAAEAEPAAEAEAEPEATAEKKKSKKEASK